METISSVGLPNEDGCTLPCQHKDQVHTECLRRWFENTRSCPVCRASPVQASVVQDIIPSVHASPIPPEEPLLWWLLKHGSVTIRTLMAHTFRHVKSFLNLLIKLLQSLVELIDASIVALAPNAVESHEVRPEQLRRMTLGNLRATSIALGVTLNDLRRSKRDGENLSRRNDYASALIRFLQLPT